MADVANLYVNIHANAANAVKAMAEAQKGISGIVAKIGAFSGIALPSLSVAALVGGLSQVLSTIETYATRVGPMTAAANHQLAVSHMRLSSTIGLMADASVAAQRAAEATSATRFAKQMAAGSATGAGAVGYAEDVKSTFARMGKLAIWTGAGLGVGGASLATDLANFATLGLFNSTLAPVANQLDDISAVLQSRQWTIASEIWEFGAEGQTAAEAALSDIAKNTKRAAELGYGYLQPQ